MLSERELTVLLHRADWTRLTLSGTVTGSWPFEDAAVTVESREPGWPWQGGQEHGGWPWPFRGSGPEGDDAPCTLSVAPGRRFRAEGADGSWALGCDGTRMWHHFRDLPAGTSAGIAFGRPDGRPRPPYRALLMPTWLLTGYSLALDGEVTACGRPAVRVTGTRRPAAERRGRTAASGNAGDGLLTFSRARPHRAGGSEVEAVVDAELGILLWFAERPEGGPFPGTGFSSLAVGEPADASRFSAPAGSGPGPSSGPGAGGTAGTPPADALGEALGAAGRQAAKAVAGIAAGGLSALVRHASARHADPFARAAAEAADPEAAMPADEPPPGEPRPGGPQPGGPWPAEPDGEPDALPDEVAHLLYRGGLREPPLNATLHQWTDFGALLAAVPPSARGKAFGGLGFLADATRDVARESAVGDQHEVRRVTLGGWTRYRVDVVRSARDAILFPRPGRAGDVVRVIASDGTRQWQVRGDRVVTGPASPPPGALAEMLDASWLLDGDIELSGDGEAVVAGRRAYRIVARRRDEPGAAAVAGPDWLRWLFFPAVAVVDAETGLLLRLTGFGGGRPVLRRELRDVTEQVPGADFSFTPPAGLPVEEARPWRPAPPCPP